jgi:hypothetical protein
VKDVLIGTGILSFIALFIYAIVKEGRKQKKEQSFFFKKLADRRGWKYIRKWRFLSHRQEYLANPCVILMQFLKG